MIASLVFIVAADLHHGPHGQAWHGNSQAGCVFDVMNAVRNGP
jgi:hypothetical protein